MKINWEFYFSEVLFKYFIFLKIYSEKMRFLFIRFELPFYWMCLFLIYFINYYKQRLLNASRIRFYFSFLSIQLSFVLCSILNQSRSPAVVSLSSSLREHCRTSRNHLWNSEQSLSERRHRATDLSVFFLFFSFIIFFHVSFCIIK